MNLAPQRRMAASLLKCGENRVWMDVNSVDVIADAVTRDDIRHLISRGIIQKKPVSGTSKARAKKIMQQKLKGKRKGPGSRKGTKYARLPRKRRWVMTIRPIRATLKELRSSNEIDVSVYRKYYRLAKGGVFKSRKHLLMHMKQEGVLKEE